MGAAHTHTHPHSHTHTHLHTVAQTLMLYTCFWHWPKASSSRLKLLTAGGSFVRGKPRNGKTEIKRKRERNELKTLQVQQHVGGQGEVQGQRSEAICGGCVLSRG